MAKKWKDKSTKAWEDAWKKENILNSSSAIGAGITGIVDAALSNSKIKDTTIEDELIDATKNTQFGSGSYDNLLTSFSTANMADANYSANDVRGLNGWQMAGNALKGIVSGALAGNTVGGPWGAAAGGVVGLAGGLAGIFSGNKKARDKANELNTAAENANNQYLANFENAASNTHNTMFNNTLLNMAAKGGKIYIKPSHRGRLTELKRRTGKTEAELYNDGNPAHKKMVVFARNSRKWHHGLGGNLFDEGGLMFQHGGIFPNGITIIGNGGTHEENPFEGVQIGVDSQGVPNMVEEGEVIWQDYVFSNRLKPTKEFKDIYKVKGETFADIAKEMQRESEERPNDPISRSGLEDSMTKLMIEQEKIRSNSNKGTSKNIFSSGGNTSNDSEFLDVTEYLPWERLLFRESTELPAISRFNTLEKLADRESKRALSAPVTKLEVPTPSYTRNTRSRSNNNFLRYAPVVGSALGAVSDLIGTTNKPNYDNINLIQDATDRITPIGYTPIGTYMSYNPMDKNFYSNKLVEQAGATRRAIINQGINPGATMAGLLTADYNAQTKMGDLFRQAEEYNQAQKERVAGFNRQTDAMNAEMAMKAAIANKQSDELKLKSAMAQAQMREQADATANAARSANLTNLFDNLGAIGKESFTMDMIERNPALLYNWMGEYKACGGKINRKRRK